MGKLTYMNGKIGFNSKDSKMPYQPHPEKVKKKWEFQRAYKKGRKYLNHCFVVYVYPNKLNSARLGITASKKMGKSVERNRAKRLIREFFRLSRHRILTDGVERALGRAPRDFAQYVQNAAAAGFWHKQEIPA